ncbi:helix-turn-helix transcriptional regulator [Nocardia sp. NPDC058519]|uniref:helix-turn-helix transcriptional regulator n=1 Tax=Nocardia sp. NPDC058519 TaxID=3346535 RepID=UPI0036653E20
MADLADGRWYTTAQLAAVLGIDSSSLRRWRTAHPPCGPAYVRVSPRVVKYSAADVETWLQELRTDPRQAAA